VKTDPIASKILADIDDQMAAIGLTSLTRVSSLTAEKNHSIGELVSLLDKAVAVIETMKGNGSDSGLDQRLSTLEHTMRRMNELSQTALQEVQALRTAIHQD
jgi:hypothetical protein